MVFLSSYGLSALSVNQNIVQGIWRRTLLAGGTLLELILAQFIVHMIIMIFEIAGCLFVEEIMRDFENFGSYLLEISIIVLVYISGNTFGLLISMTFFSSYVIGYISFGIFLLFFVLSGIMW